MFSLMSSLGILLLIAICIVYLVRNSFPQWPSLALVFNNRRRLLYVVVLGALMALGDSLFFYSRFGHQYYLVYPTGGWSTVSTSGIKFRGFATIQEWQKEIDIKVVADDEPTEGIEGIISDKVNFIVRNSKGDERETIPGIAITFIDRVGAAV